MSFTVLTMPQRSGPWYMARAGRLTGSCAKAMLAQNKRGKDEAKTRAELRQRLVCERLTGRPEDDGWYFLQANPHVINGEQREPAALAAYEAQTGEFIQRVGFLAHDQHMAGCSLDGYLGNFSTILEVKCPKPSTHLEYKSLSKVPSDYVPQVTHNLWISGADDVHFVSWCPWLPEHLQLHIIRALRIDFDVPTYEEKALKFLEEVESNVLTLRGGVTEAATASLSQRNQ